MSSLASFHFLRPWWLLALLPAVALFLLLHHQQDTSRYWRGIVDDHLLQHLLVTGGAAAPHRLRPEHVLLAAWIVAILALAGPTWRLEPTPFAQDQAALVVVLKVTPSMKERDVQPSRLTRSVQKIKDLMAARPGARTGLIAYAGSAHRVVPLTDDPAIIDIFAPALAPDLMPTSGDAMADALKLAARMIEEAHQPGSILLIADGIAANQVRPDLPHVTILAPVAVGPELEALQTAAGKLGATLVGITLNEADVRRLARLVETSIVAVTSEGGEHWQDASYWLVPLVALLALLWFRPGWVARSG